MTAAVIPILCVVILGAFMFTTYYSILNRMAAALFYVVISGLFLVSVSESIGRPKPTWSEVRSLNKATLISALPVFEDKIYLWLLPDGSDVPVAFVMPWSMEAAQDLQNATQEAEENGTAVTIQQRDMGDEDAPENTYQFHANPPQPPEPPKSIVQ